MIVRLVIKSNQFNHLLHRKSLSGEGFASHNLRIIEQLFNHSSAHIISYKHLCLAWPGLARQKTFTPQSTFKLDHTPCCNWLPVLCCGYNV